VRVIAAEMQTSLVPVPDEEEIIRVVWEENRSEAWVQKIYEFTM